MTSLGASSDSLMMKFEIDLGPFVSLLLNSFVLNSLRFVSALFPILERAHIPKNLVCELWIIVLFR